MKPVNNLLAGSAVRYSLRKSSDQKRHTPKGRVENMAFIIVSIFEWNKDKYNIKKTKYRKRSTPDS